MDIKTALLGAAALYALGRSTRETSLDDLRGYAQDLSGISGKDARKYAMRTADDALLRVGLRRAAAVPSATGLVMAGAAAGLLVGAGLSMFLSE